MTKAKQAFTRPNTYLKLDSLVNDYYGRPINCSYSYIGATTALYVICIFPSLCLKLLRDDTKRRHRRHGRTFSARNAVYIFPYKRFQSKLLISVNSSGSSKRKFATPREIAHAQVKHKHTSNQSPSEWYSSSTFRSGFEISFEKMGGKPTSVLMLSRGVRVTRRYRKVI